MKVEAIGFEFQKLHPANPPLTAPGWVAKRVRANVGSAQSSTASVGSYNSLKILAIGQKKKDEEKIITLNSEQKSENPVRDLQSGML